MKQDRLAVGIETGRAADIEYGIQPPMRRAVSMPVRIDGRHSPVVVYVAQGVFGDDVTDAVFAEVARQVARRLATGEGGL